MEENSLANLVNEWLAPLSKRDRDVISWRYGLEDDQPQTLEEVARRLRVTRERIRQIESRVIQWLKQPWHRQVVCSLVEHIYQVLVQAGGLATEVQLVAALAEIIDLGDVNPQGVVRLLLISYGEVAEIKKLESWGLHSLPLELVLEINQQIAKILAVGYVPLSRDELLSRFKSTLLYQTHVDELNDEFILGCIRLSEKIVCRDDGCYGLERWERQYQDNIILALRRLGRPAHYTEIAEAVNSALSSGHYISPRTVHVRLMQHPDLFVWVRRRGTYGLKEWGLERTLSYEDALVQILKEVGHPLTFQQILAQLPRLRPYYDENSIVLTLSTNGRFRAFLDNTYGLANWQEEDFSTENYRVRRLFEMGSEVVYQGPKREVLEAIYDVDSFITRIRERTNRES